jgi:23S rRNA pseudouridine1911/1915/1917 synthase
VSTRAEVVPPALGGQRIDRVVALVADVSRAEAAALVVGGSVRVDDQPVTKVSERVAEGTTVEVVVDDTMVDAAPGPDPSVEVRTVLVDDEVIVVDKQPDMVVHPGAGHSSGTLVGGLLARFPELAGVGDPERPGIVHRLDRDTSGLLVVARTPRAYESLVAQLSARTVERRYLALVAGHPDPARGLVDAPLGRSPRQPTLMAVRADGKEARTRYQVLERFADPSPVALVECRLETGRTHQIRVHMRAIDHPIVGDPRYGGGRTRVACPRPFLHAADLAFVHPATGERVAATSPLPDDLRSVLAGLGPVASAD